MFKVVYLPKAPPPSVYVRPRYCLMKRGQKAKCFDNPYQLIHYWSTRVNIYDEEELNSYTDLCQKMFKNEYEEHSY